jgi:endogenous inhibitor of DNA gyrase (YacG/DUF329 family)
MTRSEAGKLGGIAYRQIAAELRQRRIIAWATSPKICEQCNTALLYEKRHNRFCGHRCRAIKTNHDRGNKSWAGMNRLCASGCGRELTRKQKLFCSAKCQMALKRLMVIRAWQSGVVTGHNAYEAVRAAVREYMLERAGHKCSRCGWGEINEATGRTPLHIDHIDGEPTNSAENNLRVLCPNCHSLTPTYGGANVGNGRSTRRSRYRKSPCLRADDRHSHL